MGQTLQQLSKKELTGKPIFSNRFVIEICEKVHTHYRNFRIVQSLDDFINMAEGFAHSLDRWKKRGCPGTGSRHIELCRKNVAVTDHSDSIEVNLNDNLYNKNEGIYSEGADFAQPQYIHLKIRDVRIEMSIGEFNILTEALSEAKSRLEDSSFHVALSTP
jgi:hypothetical protein